MKRILIMLLALVLVMTVVAGCDASAEDGSGTVDGTIIESGDGGDTDLDEDKDKDSTDNESGLEGDLDSGGGLDD